MPLMAIHLIVEILQSGPKKQTNTPTGFPILDLKRDFVIHVLRNLWFSDEHIYFPYIHDVDNVEE